MFWLRHVIRGLASYGASWLATGWIVEELAPGVPYLHTVFAIVLALAMLAAFALTEVEA